MNYQRCTAFTTELTFVHALHGTTFAATLSTLTAAARLPRAASRLSQLAADCPPATVPQKRSVNIVPVADEKRTPGRPVVGNRNLSTHVPVADGIQSLDAFSWSGFIGRENLHASETNEPLRHGSKVAESFTDVANDKQRETLDLRMPSDYTDMKILQACCSLVLGWTGMRLGRLDNSPHRNWIFLF